MKTRTEGMDLSVLGVTVGFALWWCVAIALLATFAHPRRIATHDRLMIEPATRSPVPVAQVQTKARPS